ncbi:7652_t:CDS:1, partial [Scutellospora calospora]
SNKNSLLSKEAETNYYNDLQERGSSKNKNSEKLASKQWSSLIL